MVTSSQFIIQVTEHVANIFSINLVTGKSYVTSLISFFKFKEGISVCVYED